MTICQVEKLRQPLAAKLKRAKAHAARQPNNENAVNTVARLEELMEGPLTDTRRKCDMPARR